MPITDGQIGTIRAAATGLDFFAPLEPVMDFTIRVLGLSAEEQLALFGADDADEPLSLTNKLTAEIERLLTFEGAVPSFGILVAPDFVDRIGGFGTVMLACGAREKTVTRLRWHAEIRAQLRSVTKGHDLEAIAAAILEAAVGRGHATRGSGDQGVDVLGWQPLASTFPLFASLVERGNQPSISNWEKVFFIASSKANLQNAEQPTVLNPAFIRELVGTWLIQRTSIGHWSDAGILPLSAVQVILVTTYRLSSEARRECRRSGCANMEPH